MLSVPTTALGALNLLIKLPSQSRVRLDITQRADDLCDGSAVAKPFLEGRGLGEPGRPHCDEVFCPAEGEEGGRRGAVHDAFEAS